jgi:hypothetical protein
MVARSCGLDRSAAQFWFLPNPGSMKARAAVARALGLVIDNRQRQDSIRRGVAIFKVEQ